ncbi:MAG: ribonuclease Y [Helicobacteraceae bacterium]|jgi:ribonuclease Y|nr:ribonuclease Y [Helicobacteraceae bacterium]
MTEIIVGVIAAFIGASIAWFITRKIDLARHSARVEQAKAKAKAIENEAQMLLERAKAEVSTKELELKTRLEHEFAQIRTEQEKRALALEQKEETIEEKRRQSDRMQKEVARLQKDNEQQRLRNEQQLLEAQMAIERAAGMTANEAKALLLAQIEEKCRLDAANIIRKTESEAKGEARRRANFIIAQATTRYAVEFAGERLINTVAIANDEYKGRIIGKEGRNIKTLENLLGVDIIIDDTPGAIVISSFNLYRRAIATRTIELLLNDGRIQPSRIEEIYANVKTQFDESLLEEGRNILIDLNIGDLHPELTKLIGRLKYRASYGQNALSHSLEVAYLASIITAELDGNDKIARRAGLLHDIGKALTQEHEGSHVQLGAEVCKRFGEGDIVLNAINAHHGHEEPLTIEAASVCAADALSAARPGARREVLESFLKRVQEVENIATTKRGVSQAYAISAGRELRVIVNANEIDDRETILLSKEIAGEIEQKMQYPGEIKVNVIRELRAVEMAR